VSCSSHSTLKNDKDSFILCESRATRSLLAPPAPEGRTAPRGSRASNLYSSFKDHGRCAPPVEGSRERARLSTLVGAGEVLSELPAVARVRLLGLALSSSPSVGRVRIIQTPLPPSSRFQKKTARPVKPWKTWG
jgi:hypothetical protein